MKKILPIIVIMIWIPVFSNAADLNEVQSIPSVDPEIAKLEAAIGFWDGYGRIDAVYSDRIVINDSNYQTTSGMNIIALDGTPYKFNLAAGMFVYYFTESKMRISKLAVDTDN